jgi:nucleosome binding factor SPN SPT16 subunit
LLDTFFISSIVSSSRFAMGLEFRENSIIIGPKCAAVLKKGMIFNVNIGISGLENKDASDKEGKVYALFIGDTVLINDEPPASVLTQSKKKIKNVGIFLKDDDEEEEEEEKVEVKPQEQFGRNKRSTAVLENKLRSEHSSEEKRKQHQRELAMSLNEKAQERLAKQSGGKETEKVRKSTVSYKSVNQMPREAEVKELKLYVGK